MIKLTFLSTLVMDCSRKIWAVSAFIAVTEARMESVKTPFTPPPPLFDSPIIPAKTNPSTNHKTYLLFHVGDGLLTVDLGGRRLHSGDGSSHGVVGPDDEGGAPVPETLGGGRVVRRGHQYHGALQLPWLHTFKGAFIRVLNVFVLGGVIASVGRQVQVTVDVYYVKTFQDVLLQTQARFILNVSN